MATPDAPVSGMRKTGRIAMLALLAAGALAAWHWRSVVDPVTITAAVNRFPAAPLAFLAIHIAASLLFVPRTLLAIAAGLMFGIGWGVFWAELGSVAGAVAGFLVARYVSPGVVDIGRSTRAASILQHVERGGWRAVAVLRLVPVMPHSLTNYALGLTGLAIGPYAFGSMVGQLPITLAYVGVGSGGGRLMAGDAGWLQPTLIGLAVLALSLLIPVLSRRRESRVR